MRRVDSLEKTLMLGGIGGRRITSLSLIISGLVPTMIISFNLAILNLLKECIRSVRIEQFVRPHHCEMFFRIGKIDYVV